MRKGTLNKLRRYIDLAAVPGICYISPGFHRDAGREQLWQEFVEAVLAEEDELPDEVVALYHAVADLME